MTDVEGDAFSQAEFHWSAAKPVLRNWVGEHKQAISLLLAGSERPEAYFEQPGRSGSPLDPVDKNVMIIRLSWIGTAALFEADRLRTQGDVAGAWALLKAVIRTSRNMERAVRNYWSRGTAMTLAQYAREPVSQWAKDPAVNVALLRRALDDVAAAEALTPPLSAFYRGEYHDALESLANLQPLIAERARRARRGRSFRPLGFRPQARRLSSGRARAQPQGTASAGRKRSGLVRSPGHRAAAVRGASAADLSGRPGRAARVAGLAARGSGPLGRFDPGQSGATLRMGDLERLERDDRWSVGQLKESIAVPLFTREMGRPPASSAEALKR